MRTIKSTVEQEQEKKLAEALMLFKGKIIGYNEEIGIYELTTLASGGTDEPPRAIAVGKTKHTLKRGTGENYMRFSLISRHLRWLQGELLTILEATIDDERKLKATKDLVKDKISSKISWIYEQCGLPEDEEDGLSTEE